ncbi:MAG TPA: AMP-binding protein, partial [Myxococcales bacterium]|nr:AMP-binding protein [Myxococcales bacterium]
MKTEGLALASHDTRWTYRDLDEQTRRWADRLAARGVGEGDRVAHLSRTTPDTVALT